MVSLFLSSFILSDDASLQTYLAGDCPPLQDIKRRIVEESRNSNSRIGQHHYALAMSTYIRIKEMRELLPALLKDIATNFLEREVASDRIHVKNGLQGSWHQLLTIVPPLLVKSFHIYQANENLNWQSECEVLNLFQRHLLSNNKHTSLPSANSNKLLAEGKGFDLHIHLNGTIEHDFLWQSHLGHPLETYKFLENAFKSDIGVKSQLERVSSLLTPYKFYTLLRIARRIRRVMFDIVAKSEDAAYLCYDDSHILNLIVDISNVGIQEYYLNEFASLIPGRKFTEIESVAIEGLMFCRIFAKLREDGTELLAYLFHFYLLIYALANKLVVQQSNDFGFDQFQKITLNKLRDLSELTYYNRFFQIFGNEYELLENFEGRFSPKATVKENHEIIGKIKEGWERFCQIRSSNTSKSFVDLPLRLVCHLIKKPEDDKDEYVRHKSLRKKIWRIGKTLATIKADSRWGRYLVGIDAASNELHSPPEVFAPVYRYLRSNDKAAFQKFTFHVGEDYFHPLSGIRAVYEAIEFLKMGNGDRLGHCTSLGIDPVLWGDLFDRRMQIGKGEWLDNLVFLYFYLTEIEKRSARYLLKDINHLTQEIYGRTYPIRVLINAWRMRDVCPIISLPENEGYVRQLAEFDTVEWQHANKYFASTDETKELFRWYHSKSCREKYKEPIDVKPFGILSLRSFTDIQVSMLSQLKARDIVIETLPTSNVRISSARNFTDYHFARWQKWKDENRDIPDIVIGTDDTGIFATNLFNEYACILENLASNGFSRSRQKTIVKELIANSKKYRF